MFLLKIILEYAIAKLAKGSITAMNTQLINFVDIFWESEINRIPNKCRYHMVGRNSGLLSHCIYLCPVLDI